MSATTRTMTSAILFSVWIVTLFSGWSGGGLVHLVLLASLLAFPWRAARTSD